MRKHLEIDFKSDTVGPKQVEEKICKNKIIVK